MTMHVSMKKLARRDAVADERLSLLQDQQQLRRLLLNSGASLATNALPSVLRLHPRGAGSFVLDVEAHSESGQALRFFVEAYPSPGHTDIDTVRRRIEKQAARLSLQSQVNHVHFDLILNVSVRPWGFDELIDGLSGVDMQSWLADVLPDECAAPCAKFRPKLMSHRLNRRAVIELSDASLPQHYVKVYKKGSRKAERALNISRLLQRTAFNEQSPVQVPQVAGGLKDWPGYVMSAKPGDGLALDGSADGFALAGNALGRLHRLPFRTELAHSVADEIQTLMQWIELVHAMGPLGSAQYAECFAAVESQLQESPMESVTMVHRDFHMGQLLVSDGKATLLDFDTVCNGEPAQDIGNFLAHLEWSALMDDHKPDAAAAAFLEAYAATHQPAEAARISAHRNATLLRLACIYRFSTQWKGLAPRLLDLIV